MFISKYLQSKQPSIIRLSQTKFEERDDDTLALNVAIGNVSLPMHPAMQKRMFDLKNSKSPFKDGIVKYSSSAGLVETQEAFLNIISSSGFDASDLHIQITDGASLAIELCVLGLSGRSKKPILVFDPIYTTYRYMAERLGRSIVSLPRTLNKDGGFSLPPKRIIESFIKKYSPSAILVIPYDNPTGQFFTKKQMVDLAGICVKNDMWLISDEAYRELYYTEGEASSIWGVTNSDVSGIEGKRISIESASKVWNACGLRVGAIVSDNSELIKKMRAEYTIYVCTNTIGQYVFGALANEKREDLQKWYVSQRDYYKRIITNVGDKIKEYIPGIIVTKPEAAIYFIIDFSKITDNNFTALGFAMYCAEKGKVKIREQDYTLLMSPISPFYYNVVDRENMGRKQIRISCVESEEKMKMVPILLKNLFDQYISKK